MGKILKNTWALFTGIGIILLANGLQGNLMGVRSVIENFSSLSTGIIMSGYFVGLLKICLVIKNFHGY